MNFFRIPAQRISCLILFFAVVCVGSASCPREVLSLNQGWRFQQGEIVFPVPKSHHETYKGAKAGNVGGPAASHFDDTGWREVAVPHDWVVEGPFDSAENTPQGYRPRGIGFYRRHFKLDPADQGKHLELQFDGVATHATVWFNGTLVARNFCGYTSFQIDITALAQYGENINTVAVRADANAIEGWWYEGGGIYRNTWLVKRQPLHIVTDGVFANPVRAADGAWTVPVEATIENTGTEAAKTEVEAVLLDPAGREVARTSATGDVAALKRWSAVMTLKVADPQLWSVDRPTLYQVRAVVRAVGAVTDEVTTTCGFRTLRFDAKLGFFLNDQPLKIKGTCNHQDHAGVGVAVPDSLWEFRLRRLKEMGSNAYRCAHHPPSREFLDACDRIGMLVMDENRNFDISPEGIRQLEWMVRRDRSHPSVFMWSVFNEEPMQGTRQGYEMVRRMAAAVKALDTTRPVTAAMNGGHFSQFNVARAVDVVGFNYTMDAYDRFHSENPDKPMISSEDTSALMTRGEFFNDLKRNVLDSYDEQSAGWGGSHRRTWKMIHERPFVAGSFVWTGFDYHGEPTPFSWPTHSSSFGCLDLCGFPKTAFHIRQAQWVEGRPVLHLAPHWNWPDMEGKSVKVLAITNADAVELSLNGKSLGKKSVDPHEMAVWEVPYSPGRLEAVALRNGVEVSRCHVETTGRPAMLRLTPDRAQLLGDGRDAMPVTVEALDENGRPVPTANLPVEFELSGPGEIIGLGNGDPNSHEPEKGGSRSLFNGLAQAIVQHRHGAGGPLVLWAKSAGLRSARTEIPVMAAVALPAVAVSQPTYTLLKWRMSPSGNTRPDPNQQIAGNDQNTWQEVWTDKLRPFPNGKYAVFRTAFEPFHQVRAHGGRVSFTSITGKAEVWLDGRRVAIKETYKPGSLAIDLPPGSGARTISLLIETRPGDPAGMDRAVTVTPKDATY